MFITATEASYVEFVTLTSCLIVYILHARENVLKNVQESFDFVACIVEPHGEHIFFESLTKGLLD